jgi:hypothetical protein
LQILKTIDLGVTEGTASQAVALRALFAGIAAP